jgi:ABC-type transport system substrate-binding protein
MISPRCALALIFGAALLTGCDNNPHPAPLRQIRDDGSPWLVRYSYLGDDPRSLDPQVAYDQMSRRVLEPVQDCLLEYHPFKTNPYELAPCILEAMPERAENADGSVTYNCRVRKGVFFHDDPCFPGGKGRELIAQDVEYAWKRIADPHVECPIFQVFSDFVKGYEESRIATEKAGGVFDYTKPIPGIEVVDNYTFKVHLRKPYPQIVYWMGMHFTTPVAREAVEYWDGKQHPGEKEPRQEFKWHPVGTGAFRIHEYERAHRIRLVRNPNYTTVTFPSDAIPPEREALLKPLGGKQLPLLDEVEFQIIREQFTMWLLARQGYFDGTGVAKDAYGRVVTANQELSPDLKTRGMKLEKDVELSTFYITFNTQDPVLSNKKLRQALAHSFNRKKYTEVFFNGVPLVAQQLVPPGMFGHLNDRRDPRGFDLEKGRQLIAEAGYPNGIDPKTGQRLTLTMEVTATGSDERQMAEFQKSQFEALGVQVQVNENTFAQMLKKQDDGTFQIAPSTGWGADYPDPENYYFLYYSKNIPPVGQNSSRYNNPEYDRLFEKMAVMDNSPERLEIIKQMNALLDEDCPAAWDFHKAFFTVVQPWAPRTHNNMMLEGGLKYGTIDAPLREKLRAEWNRPILWPLVFPAFLVIGAVVYAVRRTRRANV